MSILNEHQGAKVDTDRPAADSRTAKKCGGTLRLSAEADSAFPAPEPLRTHAPGVIGFSTEPPLSAQSLKSPRL